MDCVAQTYCQRFFLPPTPAFKQCALKRVSHVGASIGTLDPVFVQLRSILEPPAYQYHA